MKVAEWNRLTEEQRADPETRKAFSARRRAINPKKEAA